MMQSSRLHAVFHRASNLGTFDSSQHVVSNFNNHRKSIRSIALFCLPRNSKTVETVRRIHHFRVRPAQKTRPAFVQWIQRRVSTSQPLVTKFTKAGLTEEQETLISTMNMRMINENSFLSWCRNAYLSTVVGAAMLSGGSTALAQDAGAGAFVVGGMNLFWGTGCHVTNLIRLRHVTGMSGPILFLNVLGSTTHCFLWMFAVMCYAIGYLDECNTFEKNEQQKGLQELRKNSSASTDV